MIGDIRALLARHLPDYEVRTVVPAGHGVDNTVHLVNGELIVRARVSDPAAVRREVALLATVKDLVAVRVPDVLFADDRAGVIAYHALPGQPLDQHPVADPKRLAEPLGKLLGALHAVPPERVRELAPPDVYPAPTLLHDAQLDYRDVEGHVPAEQRPLVERFLAAEPPPEPRTLRFCHNDLGAEHLLADPETSTLTGVIDWTDAAVTDPAHDFAKLYRDLGPEVFDLILASYDGPFDGEDRRRALFYARCALIEDLAYGLSTGPPRYAEAALAHLEWTFTG
ncbi:phosphotransferase family protein [Nonomuraea sp. NPDC048826]|uniref:phosphotransferase family protein n=1 Tax=Nonomuraea sp. NPDC048826 TaxID=3364347 RepID=UPI00371805E1